MIPGRLVLALILALLFQTTGSLVGPIIFHNLVDTCTITALATTIYRLRQQGNWPPQGQPVTANQEIAGEA
jgi:hypothetical protein